MRQTLTARVTAVLIALSIAAPALAQSTMVRGKVIDAKKEGIPNVTIIVESLGGSGRKLTTKTDKKGEFVQLLTESGMYRITASDPKIGSASNDTRVVLGKVSEMTIVLVPSTAANDSAKAAELKKTFEEGVTASRAGQHDARDREVQRRARHLAGLLRLPVQHRRRADGEEGREGRGRGVEEGARDEARLRRGPQRAVDALQQPEALRRSRGDEREGGGGRRRRAAAPTPRSTRASSSGTRARSPKPR